MPSLSPFNRPGQWFKGNLHTHTTQSDGAVSPAENLTWHAQHGYAFVAITDHNRVTDPHAFVNPLPLFTIPAAEISARRGSVDYHVVSLGIQAMPLPQGSDVQETIDAVNAAGGTCFIAHPYWHDLTLDDLLILKGHLGMEIFNTGCWLEIDKGHALVHWDGVLRRGQWVWGLATDDSHFRDPDYGQGWVMVRSGALDVPAILDALRRGDFYSSRGPEILDVQVEGRQVTVRCSPARTIYLIGDSWHCPHAVRAKDGQLLSEATLTLHAQQRYFRVEVVDDRGRPAWTNPYPVQDDG